MKDQVLLFVKRDRMLLIQENYLLFLDMLESIRNSSDLHAFGKFSFQSKKDGLVTTETLPSESEGTVEIDLDSADLRER